MERSATREDSSSAAVDVNWAKRVLAGINWDFSAPFSVGRSGARLFDCRKHHWFPATFVPEIPYTLIEVLTKPGAVIYDPFAGIGTTVLQAVLLGRKPYATEICRVAVDFIRSLLILLDPRIDISGTARQLAGIGDAYDPTVDYSQALLGSSVSVERLRPWFAPNTFNQVMYLASCELRLAEPAAKAAMRISLSALLKTLCAQDRGWGCIADNMLPTRDQLKREKNALERVRRHANSLLRDVSKVREILPPDSQSLLSSGESHSWVWHGDARRCTNVPDESVDQVVTSPPYPNMTDYSTSQRLSYYWLGSDPVDDLRLEIGARRKRFAVKALSGYRDDMKDAMDAICRKVRAGGYVCLVMPNFDSDDLNSSARRQVVQECLALLHANGLVLEQELRRFLPIRRRHHNQRWASLESERIHVYRKAP
jgi:hypothetical protein